jgi:hypothetical protein
MVEAHMEKAEAEHPGPWCPRRCKNAASSKEHQADSGQATLQHATTTEPHHLVTDHRASPLDPAHSAMEADWPLVLVARDE